MYLTPLLDVRGKIHVWSEEIFPLLVNILINTMFAQTPTSSGMGFGAIITLGITLGFIICFVDRRFFCSWRRGPLSVWIILGKTYLISSVVKLDQDAYQPRSISVIQVEGTGLHATLCKYCTRYDLVVMWWEE